MSLPVLKIAILGLIYGAFCPFLGQFDQLDYLWAPGWLYTTNMLLIDNQVYLSGGLKPFLMMICVLVVCKICPLGAKSFIFVDVRRTIMGNATPQHRVQYPKITVVVTEKSLRQKELTVRSLPTQKVAILVLKYGVFCPFLGMIWSTRLFLSSEMIINLQKC